MMGARTDLGFSDEIDGFDPAAWTPVRTAAPAPAVRGPAAAAAQATGFRSREPVATAAPAPLSAPSMSAPSIPAPYMPARMPDRRRRTGRNAQFNLKARPETIAAFCQIADAQGWGLGETLEQAVRLLEAQYGQGQGQA